LQGGGVVRNRACQIIGGWLNAQPANI
jgi:hypothetical protein